MDDRLISLQQRRSVASRLLGEPGPDQATLEQMLRAAVRVPDHGALNPWRFVLIRGTARQALGELLARRSRERDPNATDAVVEKDRQRFNHAPLIVTVVARIQAGHRIPEQEQLLSAGCVCFSLLQAAQALGFGAQWLTGWAAYDAAVGEHLGLEHGERVAGFIHIGSCEQGLPERQRPELAALVTELA